MLEDLTSDDRTYYLCQTFVSIFIFILIQNVAILLLQCFVWLPGFSEWLVGGFLLIQRCLDQIMGSYNTFIGVDFLIINVLW